MVYLASYKPADSLYNRQREHSLGKSLLAFALEHEYGRCWEVKAPEGAKPFLEGAPGISFNISHTRGLAVCAVSSRTVGVDVEYVRPFRENLMRRVCSPKERRYVTEGVWSGETGTKVTGTKITETKTAGPVHKPDESCRRFFCLWTLKESFVKATGQGLRFPLGDITFSMEGGVITGSIPGWHFYQSMVYGSYIISVCEADEEGEAV